MDWSTFSANDWYNLTANSWYGWIDVEESNSPVTISTNPYLTPFDISTTVISEGDATLGADFDLAVPIVLVDDVEAFGDGVLISPTQVKMLTVPVLTPDSVITITSQFADADIRYSINNSRTLEYTAPFSIENLFGGCSSGVLRVRVYKTRDGVTMPLKGSRLLICRFAFRR